MQASNKSKVFALSLGKGLTSIIGIASAMLLTRLLTVNDYATYRQTLLVFNLMIPILTLGLPDAIYFFLGSEKQRKRGLLNDNLFLLIMMGAIYAIFIWAGGNHLWANRFHNPALVNTLKVFAPYAVFTLPLSTITATLIVQNKIQQLTIFNFVSRFFLFVFVVLSAWVFRNVIYLVSAEVISASLVFTSIIILTYKYVPKDDARINKESMLKMLKYSIPLGLSALIGTLSIQLNQVIVSSMSSPAQYAIYANGTTDIPIIGIITGSIATIILVEMRKNISVGKINESLILFQKAAIKSAPLLIPIMLFLMVMADQFVRIIYSEKYIASVHIFRIYLLVLPARIVYYSSALLAFGLSRVILFRSILSLTFNTILTIIFIHFIGYTGAIISYIIVIYFWDISFNFRILSNKFECKWYELLPMKEIGKISLISIISTMLIIPICFLNLHYIAQFVLAGLVFSSTTFLLFKKFNIIEFDLKLILKRNRNDQI